MRFFIGETAEVYRGIDLVPSQPVSRGRREIYTHACGLPGSLLLSISLVRNL